jgi:uncharacterized repeat protein (TIGR01451 family)
VLARKPHVSRRSRLRYFLWICACIGTLVLAHPFAGYWSGGSGPAVHFAPVAWPNEPSPASCGATCGDWRPYTRFGRGITDPRVQDPSNGGTAPQNYVNVASSCTDKQQPSVYYYLHRGQNPANDVIMFRWRVEQPAHNYATGTNPGTYGASNPWSSALWTVLFDIDGSGYRSLAAHLNGSSGSPAEPVDMLAGIWSNSATQSIDYSDPNIHLLAHNPTAFIGAGNRLMNFHSALAPDESWPNGAAETVWDYGTTRATLVTSSPCSEYFIDYQIPVSMLDASGVGGPQLTRDTPIAMLFCTANSLSNPFQKDCAINRQWTANAAAPAPFGDYISFNKNSAYEQPIVASVSATPPASCPGTYSLTTKVQDALAVQNGVTVTTVKSVQFYYWYDANGDGAATAADVGSVWTRITPAATLVPQTLNTWTASWNAASLPKGKYLIGVQAADDATSLDDGMTSTGVDHRTFSYLSGDSENRIYIAGAWISGQQALFPAHSPVQSPSASEDWYGNPSVTGNQVALVGTAINTCGLAPTLSLNATPASVASGNPVAFTLSVANPAGNSSAVTVSSVSDLLPAGFAYTNGSSSGTNGLPSTNPTVSGQMLTWTPASPISLAPGASASLAFNATSASSAGSYNSTASAATSFGALTSAPAQIIVDSARLSLAMLPSSYSIAADGVTMLTYTLQYSNDSGVVVTSATLSDALPAGTTYVSCTGGTACSNTAGTINWTLGSLAAGASGTATLSIVVPSSYSSFSLTNGATVSATAPDASTVSATANSTVSVTGVALPGTPAFTLRHVADASNIAPGGSATYTLTYNNTGTAAATGVALTASVPGGMSFVSCSNSCTNGSGTVSWTIGTVTAGASASRTFTLSAGSPFTSSNPASSVATLTWTSGTPVTATASVGITGQSCSTYYFSNTTTNVGFDGTKRIAAISPIPTAGDTGTTVNATAPGQASAFLEVLRFYQDPQTQTDVPFDGNITSNIYVDRNNGQGLNIRGTIYDYNSTTGVTTQLGQNTALFNGSTKGKLSFSVTPTGTLAKGHRLLWVYDVRSANNSTLPVQLQFGGTVTNGMSGGTTFADSNASYCITPPANLTLSNTASSAAIDAGTTPVLTYTLRYSNTGSASATNTVLTGALPAGFTGCEASTNGSSWSACSAVGGSPPSNAFAIGSVAAGSSGTVYVRGTVPAGTTAGATLTATSSIASDQTNAVNSAASIAVTSPAAGGTPALSLNLATNRTTAGPANTVTYTLTVVNTGSAAATNVVVSDTVPATAYYTYASCTGSCSVGLGGALTWPTIASLAVGASTSYTYTMSVATSGLPAGVTLISDDALATGDGGLTATSNTASVAINGNPSLVIAEAATPSAGLAPGDTIEYTITLANSGAADATNVIVRNPIPARTGFSGGIVVSQGSGAFDAVNNRLVFDVGTLVSGATVTLKFSVAIDSSLPSGATSIVSSATADAGNAASQLATATATANASAVLALTKTAPASVAYPSAVLTAAASGSVLFVDRSDNLRVGQLIEVGSQVARVASVGARSIAVDSPITATSGTPVNGAITLTITYRNNGDAAATASTLRETLAAGFGYYASSPAAFSSPLVGSSGDVDWNIGTLDAAGSGSVEVTAFPTGATGSFTNTATLSAANALSATASTVTSVGGLSVTKSTTTAVVSAGGTARYTIVVANSLGASAGPLTVTDLLPAGFGYVANSATVGGAPLEPLFAPDDTDGAQPIWNGLTIGPQSSLAIVFDASVDAQAGAAVYQNEVVVDAPAGVGVQTFDPLITTAEDVSVLAPASGVLKGYVYSRASGNALAFDPLTDTPLTGVRVEIHKAGADCNNPVLGNCQVVYTDANGYFEHMLAAESWIVSVKDATGDLPSGWYQLAGANDDTVAVPDQGAIYDYNGYTSSGPITHTVTATAGANGSITPASRTVNDGATTTFTITPDSGYLIDTVSGCGGSLAGSTYTTGAITADCTVTASFTAVVVSTHTVTATAGANGSIGPASRTVNDGATTTFTITPDSGYLIDTVAGCGGSLAGSTYTTGAITADCTVTATFISVSIPTHTVTASAGSGGAITPATRQVADGAMGSFTVTPDAGYSIANVTGCGGSLSGQTYTTGAITTACTVTASFGLNSYTVTASAGAGGSIGPSSANVNHGATTTFTVTPDAGYSIANVTGCGGSLFGQTYTSGLITGACSVSATFTSNSHEYTVTASAGAGGTIGPATQQVTSGATTSLTLTTDEGYELASIDGCGGTLAGNLFTTAAIEADCSVSATFALRKYAVSATAAAGGSIDPPSVLVEHGKTTSFTIQSNASYGIGDVTGCNGTLAGSVYTTGAITAACAVNATFVIVAPIFEPAVPVSINARSLFTDVPRDTAPKAFDSDGRPLEVVLVGATKLRSGRHLVTWSATDGLGRTMTTQQQIDIWPMVAVSEDLIVGFGNAAEFRVLLSGDSPVYPFAIAFAVRGPGLGTLHTLAPTTVSFIIGTEAVVRFDALAQPTSMPAQHLDVELDPAQNLGERAKLGIDLTSSNAAPVVHIDVLQGNRVGTLVAKDGGSITLRAVVSDPNPGDTHMLEWSYPPAARIQLSADTRELTLDPASVVTGIADFSVSVRDSGTPSLMGKARSALAVLATSPVLGEGDSNENGVSDAIEGWEDAGNGVPSYLNRESEPHVLPEDAPVIDRYLVEGEAGSNLRIGGYAQLAGLGGARLAGAHVANALGRDTVANVGGYFDIETASIATQDGAITVVIPQRAPIPEQAVYRLWDRGSQKWRTFSGNTSNVLASAPGEAGYCPPPGSTAYKPGLNTGDWCVQLKLDDGGPNDADHEKDGVLGMTGGVGALVTSVVTGKSAGGGSMDGSLIVLVLLACLRATRRIRAWLIAALASVAIPTLAFADERGEQNATDTRDGFYAGATVAFVHNGDDASDMDARLAAQGFVTQTHLSGRNRFGGALFAGYRRSRLALEGGYAHLGTMRTRVAGLTPVDDDYLRAIATAHPHSGKGPEASVLLFLPLSERWELFGRAGLFYWRNTLSAKELNRVRSIESTLDPQIGIGLETRLGGRSLALRAEVQLYRLSRETIGVAGVSVLTRF